MADTMAFGHARYTDKDENMEVGRDLLLEARNNDPGVSKQGMFRDIIRAGCWGICSSTALCTTKGLMVNHGYHYPLTIAFQNFLALLIAYTIAVYSRPETSITAVWKFANWGSQRSYPDSILPNRTWVIMIPAALTAGASLPMLFEGLLHMPSLPVLVMLFPVAYAAESVILFVCCSISRSHKWLPWETFVAVGASSVVLFSEYRLMVPGLIWGVTGILLIGVTRALFTVGSERSGSDIAVQAKLTSSHGFVVMSLVFGLMFSGFAAYTFEHLEESYAVPVGALGVMALNFVVILGSVYTGSTPLVYSPIEGGKPKYTNTPISINDYVTCSTSSLVVILVTIHSTPISVAWMQIAASQVASIFLLGTSQIHQKFVTVMDFTQQQIARSLKITIPEGRKPSGFFTSAAILTIIVLSSIIISIFSSLSILTIPPSLPATLDPDYEPASRFDIVVSMYDEDPASVKHMLDSIKKTKFLSTLAPNITIYIKNKDANLSALKQATEATNVTFLENLGREGGTYLHHIVHNWDTLAEQTLFIQAHAHNMRELIPRINSYLVPNTGMLSLGFTGITCKCGDCSDRHSWTDSFNIIPALYFKIYHQACKPETPILLSYKGQFVASARRIRGLDRRIYEDLLREITSTSHHEKMAGSLVDTADNPFFGFTMERVWGLLMQCGTDGSVAVKCPSLLSGMGHGGNVADCQCLDPDAYGL